MSKTDRAVLLIPEAEGKRVRQLSLAEPFANSKNIYVSIEFEDQTDVLIRGGISPIFQHPAFRSGFARRVGAGEGADSRGPSIAGQRQAVSLRA